MIVCRLSNETLFNAMVAKETFDVEVMDKSKKGLLHYACKGQSRAIVEKLLELGVNAEEPSATSKTPLHFAASTGTYEQVQLLIDHGCYVDPITEVDYASPLTLAVKFGKIRSARILLDAGANSQQASYYVSM